MFVLGMFGRKHKKRKKRKNKAVDSEDDSDSSPDVRITASLSSVIRSTGCRFSLDTAFLLESSWTIREHKFCKAVRGRKEIEFSAHLRHSCYRL